MSKFRFILIAAALALLATLMLVTCGDDSSSSNEASFKPGTYTGILTITQHKGDPVHESSDVDTLIFYFYAGDSFRADTVAGEPDPLFCPIKGEYSYTRDSLKISDISLARPAICIHLDTVDANFRLLDTDHGWLVYTTSDTALYRQLEIKALLTI
jgi:hypothetical protein